MPRHERLAPTKAGGEPVEIYSPTARRFHWTMVALLALQIPVGLYMAYRGNALNVWDATTNALYSSHKLVGMLLLALIIARLTYRIVHGAPKPEPTLETWHKLASGFNHWGLYALLLVVPVLGWFGASYYPALDIFGLFKLPGLVVPDEKTATVVFRYHGYAALALIAFVSIHVGAALYHYVIRRDNVLARMIPSLTRKS